MDGQRITEDQHTDKRLKMQCEVDMERTRSSERIAQIQATAKLKSNKRNAEIEANAEWREQVKGVFI